MYSLCVSDIIDYTYLSHSVHAAPIHSFYNVYVKVLTALENITFRMLLFAAVPSFTSIRCDWPDNTFFTADGLRPACTCLSTPVCQLRQRLHTAECNLYNACIFKTTLYTG